MFQNWGFLLGEIWGLILLAALLGLFAGWLIWNRSKELLGLRSDLESRDRELAASKARYGDLETEYSGYKTKYAQVESDYDTAITGRDAALADLAARDDRIKAMETEVSGLTSRMGLLANVETERDEAQKAKADAQSGQADEIRRVRARDEEIAALKKQLVEAQGATGDVEQFRADITSRDARIAALEGELATAKSAALNFDQQNGQVTELSSKLDQCRATVADRDAIISDLRAKVNNGAHDFDGDGVIEGKGEGTKPQTLMAARGGKADDLKMIKGVGPKLEKLLHRLGFYHFDQVASWSDQEVAWVDANLEGFTGRVSRDRWIAQAKILAAGGTTEFAERVGDGDVYQN